MKYAINGATTMKYPVEEDIVSAARNGFEGVELWWDKVKRYLENHTAAQLNTLLRENHVEAAGLCPFLVSPFRNTQTLREEFQQALEAAECINCRLLTVCPDFRPMQLCVEQALDMHGEEFKWYAGQAGMSGIKLAIEPIGRHTLVGGPMEALDLIKRAGEPDNLGLLIDTFHYMRSAVSQEVIRQIPLDKLYIVHVNDSENGMIEELEDKNRLYPTEGAIDLKSTVMALKEMSYEGYLSVELFNRKYWEEEIDRISKRAKDSLLEMLKL